MRYFTLLLLSTLSQMLIAETAAPGSATPQQPSFLVQMLPFIIIIFIFYFLVYRPQQKKAAVQQKFLTELKRGDMILTASGIIGTVKALGDKIVTLEVDNDVCIKVLRSQITENATSLNKEVKSS